MPPTISYFTLIVLSLLYILIYLYVFEHTYIFEHIHILLEPMRSHSSSSRIWQVLYQIYVLIALLIVGYFEEPGSSLRLLLFLIFMSSFGSLDLTLFPLFLS